MQTETQKHIPRPKPVARFDRDESGRCERCGKAFIAVKYVNGKDVCGCCYADVMGYLAQPHPRRSEIEARRKAAEE